MTENRIDTTAYAAISDFADFRRNHQALSAAADLDLSDNRLAARVAPLRTKEMPLPERAHRCHLAEDWVRVHGLPDILHERAYVSAGVRASLSALFTWYAAAGRPVAVPSDIYPVYLDLAAKAGCGIQPYVSYPALSPDRFGADVALVCEPAKPLGQAMSSDDMDALLAWLAGSPERRVIVDNVYAMQTRWSGNVERLYATGQAWILGSMSKTWAEPLVMGVAFAPEADAADGIKEAFAAQPVDREGLRKAHAILRHDLDFPAFLTAVMAAAGERLHVALAERGLSTVPAVEPVPRYLFLVDGNYLDVLSTHGVLGIPFSAFGSSRDDLTVVSSLSFFPPS